MSKAQLLSSTVLPHILKRGIFFPRNSYFIRSVRDGDEEKIATFLSARKISRAQVRINFVLFDEEQNLIDVFTDAAVASANCEEGSSLLYWMQ